MKRSRHFLLTASIIATVAVTTESVLADSSVDAFTLANRARGSAVVRTGDLPLGGLLLSRVILSQ